MRPALTLMALSMALLQATVQAAHSHTLVGVTAFYNEKMENKDRWLGRSEVFGFNSTDIKSVDTNGITFILIDGDDDVQDTVTFIGADCHSNKASTSVTCRKKGVGSVSMKAFTIGTTTLNNHNKARSLGSSTHTDKDKNTTHGGIFNMDIIDFHKTQWKFSNRKFSERTPELPLGVKIIPPFPLDTPGDMVAFLEDCWEKTYPNGNQKLDCDA